MKNLREIELVEKGKSAFNKQDYLQSQTYFQEVLEINHKNVDAYFHLANIFHQKGELGKAAKAFQKVLDLDPEHTEASISLSVLYNDIGQYEQAKQIFKKADERVKKQRTTSGINTNEQLGPDGSSSLSRSGLIDDQHINNKFSLKHLELADLYLTYQRFDEALFEYNKATSLNPNNFEVRVKIAKVFAKKGFVQKAISELQKLKNEDPSYMPARLALGIIYYGHGKIIEAQAEWEKITDKDPFHTEANMYLNLSKTASETTL